MPHADLSASKSRCQACAWFLDERSCAHPVAHGPGLCLGAGCSFWAAERPARAPVRILVCGGHDFHDRSQVWTWLDHLVLKRDVCELTHTGGPGVAELAQQWAVSRGVPLRTCPGLGPRLRAARPVDASQRREPVAPPPQGQGSHDADVLHSDRDWHLQAALRAAAVDGLVAFPGDRHTEDLVMHALAAQLPVWRPMG